MNVKSWMVNVLAVINILIYLIVIALWISIPEETVLNLGVSAAALILSVILILTNRERFYIFYTSLFFKKFTSAVVSIFLIAVILGFVNYLSFKNGRIWDVTVTKMNSLTDQTYEVLDSIKEPLKIRVFSLKKNFEQIQYFLELYRLHKNDLEIEYIDAELRPQAIKQANITKVPAIEVSLGDRKRIIENITEQDLSNAIVLISRSVDPVVYFVTGHGEMDISSQENEGGSHLLSLLNAKTLNIKTLNLRESKSIPEDARALVFWGSKEGFFDYEINLLREYIEKGGHALFALDPEFNGEGPVLLREFLASQGLEVHNDLVIDRLKNANGSNGTIPVIHKFDPKHPITKDFEGSVFLPLTSSMRDIPSQSGLRPAWHLLGVSNKFPASWGEMGRDELANLNLTYTEGVDYQGPLGYFAAYERKLKESDREIRMVAFGNSTFVINTYKKFPQNFVLFLNTINWLVGEDRLISFNIPGIQDKPIFMSENQIGVIFYFSVIFCPLVLFLIAFAVYKRRQRP